jgi:tripartite tricarboxylate transporter TctB family protein
MRNGRILYCVFLLSVAGYAIYQASGWSFKTALFPLAVSIPLLALVTTHLVQMIFGKEDTGSGAAIDVEFSSDVPPEVERRRVLGTFAWIVGFIISVYLIGFPLTVPLFMFTYLKFQSDVGWLSTIVATAITWGCFYGLFQWLVHIQFEDGAIQTLLGL